MKKNIYLLLSFVMLLATSCSTTSSVRYTVASQNADCVGVGPQKCLLVKKGNATEWEYFYSNIEGFQYEPGYEFVLKVKEEKLENVPADASSIKYVLVKQISKEQKESDNLPPAVQQKAQATPYQCTGKVLSIESENIGRGAAAGKFEVKVVQLQVTSSTNSDIKEGETIYCELIATPKVDPKVGREYVFKARNLHPAPAKGKYLLETDVMDLVR
ncbi:MAG TPA: DUF4377 domain-containing protein [Bacteroides reticulotermitis]|nr:DUF4377 domain-containing protein [Bacteroides reticulotermitis]